MKTLIQVPAFRPSRWGIAWLLAACTVLGTGHALAVGFWTPLANGAPGFTGHMLLLSDGTVMVQSGGATSNWFRLTPDAQGHYVNGTWSTLASMHDTRQYYSSDVLKDGRVFIAGGEYGSGAATAEIYDPVANSWAQVNPPTSVLDPSQPSPALASGNQAFIDSDSVVLANGTVLVAPVGPKNWGGTVIYDPVANSWSTGPTIVRGGYQDEASWVKLPDDSILTIDPNVTVQGLYGTNSERYIPSLNTWVNDANVPVPTSMYGPNQEIGGGFLLADGRAFFLGGLGHTALYTPSGNTAPGFWVAGADIPAGLVAQDAPAAMMVNGKVLCAVTSSSSHSPMYFYEYNPSANSFVQTTSPTGGFTDGTQISDGTSMLDLPDGTVLYNNTSSLLYVYQPDLSPLASGKPTIGSVSWNSDGSVHVKGTLLNGISQGAGFGDDAQEDSNYPLLRFTDGGGNVSYGRTYNWSSTGVQTGGRLVTTEAALPGNVFEFPGAFSLQAVANGIASDPVTFYGPVWVDFNYGGILQFGSYPFPYPTLAQGVSSVASGGTIAIKASNSHETMTISKPMTIVSVYGASTIGH